MRLILCKRACIYDLLGDKRCVEKKSLDDSTGESNHGKTAVDNLGFFSECLL